MNIASLAGRNLLRNRHRSITSLLAVVIGGLSVLMFGGYVRNITYGLETGFVTQSGHLQIQHKDYFVYGTGNPSAYSIDDYKAVIAAIKSDQRLMNLVSVVTPMLQFAGVGGNFAAGASRTVIGSGIVVDDQNRMRQWNEYEFPYVFPKLALTNTSADAAVIGVGVARTLGLCKPLNVSNCHDVAATVPASTTSIPADIANLSVLEAAAVAPMAESKIELLVANARGAPNIAQLKVVKAEEQGVKELDDIFLALHLTQAQKLIYGSDIAKITAIEIQLHSTKSIPEAEALLSEILAKQHATDRLAIVDFKVLNPFFEQTLRLFDVIFGFISILIGTIVIFMLGNTMSMAVVERTVEIGTLRAIGLRRQRIMQLFVAEGLMLGVAGAVLAVIVALGASAAVNHSGLSWVPPGRLLEVPLTVRVWGEYKLVSITVICLILVSGISAWIPARHASRMNIVDALRHV